MDERKDGRNGNYKGTGYGMIGIMISFLAGCFFGIFLTALLAANKEDDGEDE